MKYIYHTQKLRDLGEGGVYLVQNRIGGYLGELVKKTPDLSRSAYICPPKVYIYNQLLYITTSRGGPLHYFYENTIAWATLLERGQIFFFFSPPLVFSRYFLANISQVTAFQPSINTKVQFFCSQFAHRREIRSYVRKSAMNPFLHYHYHTALSKNVTINSSNLEWRNHTCHVHHHTRRAHIIHMWQM